MPRGTDDEQRLTDDIIALTNQYGRHGYRRVTALLRDAGWTVYRKRVERIRRKQGSRCLNASRNEVDYGWATDPASGSG